MIHWPAGDDAMAGKIFISYRREDEQSFAVRLYERLVDGFGKERLFFDVDSIPPGFDFVRYIEDQIRLSEIVLVVIGRDWLDAKDAHGRRRLDNPEDFVRVEIEAALKQDKHVIPVLVQGAPMPLSTQLPRNMKPLARRNAFFATHVGFRAEAERLINGINAALAHLDDQRNEETERREAEALKAETSRLEAARQADEDAKQVAESARRQEEEAKRAQADAAAELLAREAAEQERLKRIETENAAAAAEAGRVADATVERERLDKLKAARDAELLAEQAKTAAQEEKIAEARRQLRIAEARAAEAAVKAEPDSKPIPGSLVHPTRADQDAQENQPKTAIAGVSDTQALPRETAPQARYLIGNKDYKGDSLWSQMDFRIIVLLAAIFIGSIFIFSSVGQNVFWYIGGIFGNNEHEVPGTEIKVARLDFVRYQSYGLSVDELAYVVTYVANGSNAAKLGIRELDVILSIDGASFKSESELERYMDLIRQAGRKSMRMLVVNQQGARRTVDVSL